MGVLMTTYSVKECFYTLQGEGARAGRPSVFCRFSGCNLWSGRAEDRAIAACQFCDTDFVGTDGEGGGKFRSADALAEHIAWHWPGAGAPYVVFTGGEPCLQLDPPLIEALKRKGFEIAVETNGSLPVPQGVDWICVSPKPQTPLQQKTGNELKFVYPQETLAPEDFAQLQFDHFYLQPMDMNFTGDTNNPAQRNAENVSACVSYCLDHPQWSLSLQTHKLTGIP